MLDILKFISPIHPLTTAQIKSKQLHLTKQLNNLTQNCEDDLNDGLKTGNVTKNFSRAGWPDAGPVGARKSGTSLIIVIIPRKIIITYSHPEGERGCLPGNVRQEYWCSQ